VRRFFIFATISLAFIFAPTAAALVCAADCPHYLILEPLPMGKADGVQAHAYAYGWFGAGRYSSSTWHKTYSGTGYRWTFVPGY
jgi:hypothetical protein